MKKNNVIGGVLGFIVLVLVLGAGYWVYTKPSTITTPEGETIQITAEDKRDLKTLAKLYDIPQDVVPLMAKVTDPEALKEQQPGFFAKAEVGDRVAVFPEFAILFDPKAGKIKHVGPVNFGNESLGQVAFAVYNGTTNENVHNAFAQTLSATFTNAVVVARENAVGTYEKTVVIDLVGNNPEMEKIANALGADIVELPVNEPKPEGATILVIVGQDYANALQAPVTQ